MNDFREQPDQRWADRKRTQWMGFTLALATIGAVAGLAIYDRTWFAGIFGAGGVVGLVKLFVPPAVGPRR